MKKYKTFWVKIPGPIVSQPSALSPAPEAMTISETISHLSKPVSNSKFKYCIFYACDQWEDLGVLVDK